MNPFFVIVNNNILFTITEKGFTPHASRLTLCLDSKYIVWPGSKMALSLWEIYICVLMCSFTKFSCAHVLMCSFTTYPHHHVLMCSFITSSCAHVLMCSFTTYPYLHLLMCSFNTLLCAHVLICSKLWEIYISHNFEQMST